MEDLIKILDARLKYISQEYEGSQIKILVEITSGTAKCPYCGQETDKVHSHYKRNLQDLPIFGKKTIIEFKRRKFFWNNSDCSHKTFAEEVSFFEAKARRSKRLEQDILHISASLSSISASKNLREHVADIGKSAICSLIKKPVGKIDKRAVMKVCIDDFAIKKRQRYASVMVDLESHRIVDMLESRERDNVREWLKEYPNIILVSRDESRTYKQAITEAKPKALQVSDRFHLIKNLCDKAKDVFRKMFVGRITIPKVTAAKDYHELMRIGSVAE